MFGKFNFDNGEQLDTGLIVVFFKCCFQLLRGFLKGHDEY